MKRYGILCISNLAILLLASSAFAIDQIRLTNGTIVNGDVLEIGPTEIKVDVTGVPKTFAVNQIDYIQFDDEPKELFDARTKMPPENWPKR